MEREKEKIERERGLVYESRKKEVENSYRLPSWIYVNSDSLLQ